MRMLIAIPTVTGREDHLTRCLAAYQATAPVRGVVDGRSVTLRDVLRFFDTGDVQTPDDAAAIFVYRDRPTCGAVWNEAAADARKVGADVLHCTADDMEPLDNAWWLDACSGHDDGYSPVYRIVSANTGTAESHGESWGAFRPGGGVATMTRIPTLDVRWWRDIPPIHYWSDNAVSAVLSAQGVPMVTSEATFRHHWAQPGRRPGGGPVAQSEQDAFAAFVQQGAGS